MVNEVVDSVSEDQVFSELALNTFEKETGVKVRVVYDTEETKGTGVRSFSLPLLKVMMLQMQ
ncbi:MAG: hypothetical protein SCALA701_20330 [Candidatus Scalindua sp.]|nr:MAG: hypothetical protein SCALA701_20330 [Candidatus Scalindua sp.]